MLNAENSFPLSGILSSVHLNPMSFGNMKDAGEINAEKNFRLAG